LPRTVTKNLRVLTSVDFPSKSEDFSQGYTHAPNPDLACDSTKMEPTFHAEQRQSVPKTEIDWLDHLSLEGDVPDNVSDT
jgi:hypothetical protein